MDYTEYTTKTSEEVLRKFSTTQSGLTSQEAQNRRKIYGQNILSAKEVHWYFSLLRQFQSPFLYLLVGAGLLSFFLRETLDGFMIFLFIAINSILGFIQEYRSEKTLQLLKQYVVAKTKVYRDGKEEIITSAVLVPGDVILIKPGDILPADIRFLATENILLDESVLTGESVAITKTADALSTEAKEIYQAKNIGFSGTHVVSGEGKGLVIGTGKNTAIGNISSLTAETKHTSSFEKEIGKLSSFVLKLILLTIALILVANIIIKGTEHIPTLIIFSVALAISVVPEALPVVTTFSFSRGALHLAKHKVVVKRLSAIEDLGSIEVLCTDKTGTITENQLTVSDINGHQETIFYACLATPFHKKEQTSFDPFDIALLNKLPQEKKEKLQSYETIDEIPFDPQRRRNTVLVTNKTEKELISRGAFENIFPLCKKNSTITSVQKWIDQQGEQGKRVLAIAKKTVNTDRAEKQEEKDMEFLGLISFIDPLKKTSHQAIAQAKKLQVDIKILTGDSKEVAGAVAYQIGLIADPHTVITGEEFDALGETT
ncbi:MAG: cation-transporting P-type ATPase [Bacteroidetes bacterium]|nr:MAG: cation-transporting P-type ATPase [Bacteroidota bacterium]